MSNGIVLSSAVRQNLLSLQQTAQLLATTQNNLATGNKVNSALDNPTNYFTAQALNTRASDISNLLDGISNGVQVLQAANTGITSLQSLIQNAHSVAQQALQATIGYSTLSNVSTTIGGATAADLRGNTTYTNATANSNVLYTGAAGGATAATSGTTLGGISGLFTGTVTNDNSAAAITTGTLIEGAAGALTTVAATKFANGDVFTVNGKTITVSTAAAPTSSTVPSGSGVNSGGTGNIVTDGNGNSTVYLGATTTVGDFLTAFDLASGVQTATITSGVATFATTAGQTASTIAAGAIKLQSTTGADLTLSGKADDLKAFGLTSSTGSGTATVQAFRTTSSTTLGSLILSGSTLNVDGKTITFKDAATPGTSAVPSGSGVSGNVVTDGNGNSTVYLQQGTIADVLKAIDLATGTQTAANSGGTATLTTATGATNSSITAAGQLKISTGLTSDLGITGAGNALADLGLAGNTGTQTSFTAARTATPGSLSGKTLTFSSFNTGTAVNVTFGDGTNGTVKSLTQLNAALQANNLTASIDSTGKLTIQAGNDYASSTLGGTAGGAIGGTATSALTWTTAAAPVADAASQATRAGLVTQYNNILDQITKTAKDASFNGINLLNGDQLLLVLDETGQSKLNITGVTDNATGLGLSNLTQGTDFIDNNATNKILTSLTAASGSLSSLASTLGSNLSIVQNRQTFSTSLINVLQTGASNLTIADPNAEAAASQALTTRQSIAVSALALANQNQQSVLQLLR